MSEKHPDAGSASTVEEDRGILLGGYAAMAESAWMGSVQAAFPRLADHAAELRWKEMRQTLVRALAAAMALAIPTLLALLLGRFVIRILFERGAFDVIAGNLTFQVLEIYTLALPFCVATELVTRGLIALRDTRTPLFTNFLQLAGRILLMTVLFGQLDVLAVPAAFAISASIETQLLSTVLWVQPVNLPLP